MTRPFDENTRVKIPATLQFLRLGYNYQSLQDSDIDFDTKIFVNRFKPAIEKINRRSFTDDEILQLISEIHSLIRNNDLGRSFYRRLTDTTADVKLVDFDCIENNDFAVVDELSFTVEKDTKEGSFRPDINDLLNGMPLAFLEVKKPNNEGGIQQEFNRMVNQRLKNPAFTKYFNLIQLVSFSNNMEYENDDSDDVSMIRAGSFYTTPNGQNTSFSFFREDEKAARVLHAALSDALEDDIFPDALGGGLVVTHGIAGAAVQEPVEPGTGSVCDAPHFEEQGPDTAHGKIPQDTRAGGAPADNDDCGFLHTLLQICHVKDIVMSHP